MNLLEKVNSSVATRTTVLMVLVVMTIMLSAGLWQMQRVRNFVSTIAHRQTTRSIENAIKMIDDRASHFETAVHMAAAYANLFAEDDDEAYALLNRLLMTNMDISSATLLYRANYFPKHGRYYAPTVSRDPVTGFVGRSDIGGPQHDFCYLENDSNWVYVNKLNHGYWSTPYMDSVSAKRVVISYSVPLHDAEGVIYAVLCTKVGLEWVKRSVNSVKPFPYSEAIVMSRDSQLVYYPDTAWVQSINVITHAREHHDGHFLELTERMMRFERGIDTLDKVVRHSDQSMTPQEEGSPSIVFYAPIERLKWSVGFAVSEQKIMAGPNKLGNFMIGLLCSLLVIVSAVLYFILHYQLRPLSMLSASVEKVATGNFHVELPTIRTQDEVGKLRDTFENMQKSLSRYVEELKRTTASKASMESELRIASDIQKTMIPKVYPPYPERDDIEIYGSLMPAREVGGDLFDYFIRDEKLFFCIGDVSGKGVPASLVMAVTHSLFRSVSAHEDKPDRIVTMINESLSLNNDAMMFVTLFVGVLDLPTGHLHYCNAGHDTPMLLGQRRGMLPCDANIPVGVQAAWEYTPQHIIIDPQTTIFLYTDGLTEAENRNYELFGEHRVKNIANKLKSVAPENIIHDMTIAVQVFVGEARQSDDLTMLAIQYTKQKYADRFQRSICLDNDVQEVARLNAFVDEICEVAGFDMSTTMKMNLAIEEAVVNVINYAYPAGTHGTVNIMATINEKRLKFVIMDSGAPFDPTAKEEADTTLSAEERPIGGLGIFLVRQLMDSINYERVDGQNVLTLRKKLETSNNK